MWVSSLQVKGLGAPSGPGAPDAWSFERVDTLGPAPARTADALRLLAGGLDRSRAHATCRALGWDGERSEEAPELLVGLAPLRVAGFLDEAARDRARAGQAPEIAVEATFELDPPLFGRLREVAVRDPQLADGLAEGTLTTRVSWTFTADLRQVFVEREGLALGSAPVPLADPQPWVERVLTDLGRRVRVLDPVPMRDVARALADALQDADPEVRLAARQALDALSATPFPHGPVDVVRSGSTACLALGPELRPFAWAGEDAAWHGRLAALVHLERPDVLAVPQALDGPVRAWLAARTRGDDAALEQVLVAGDPG